MKKIANLLPILGVIQDFKNYREWSNVIHREKSNSESTFNKFGLDHNFFYILYMVITLPEEDRVLPDNIKRLRVVELLKPIHQYLDEDLGFANYIIPEFNQFVDNDGNPTLAYGIVYRFAFKTFSFKWLITRLLLIGTIGLFFYFKLYTYLI
jgi:hypothetical protein